MYVQYLISSFFSEYVHWDLNYGIDFAEWDKGKPSDADLKGFYEQLAAINSSGSTVLYQKCEVWDLKRLREFMLNYGYYDAHPFYWYKWDQNVQGMGQYTYSVEAGIVGYKNGRKNATFNQEGDWASPINRQNIVCTKTVKTFYKDADNNQPVNTAESPMELSNHLASMHTNTSDLALVIGGGSGADVLGCVGAGCEVIVIDNHPSMIKGMKQRFNMAELNPLRITRVLPLAKIVKAGLADLQRSGLDSIPEVEEKEEEEPADSDPKKEGPEVAEKGKPKGKEQIAPSPSPVISSADKVIDKVLSEGEKPAAKKTAPKLSPKKKPSNKQPTGGKKK